MRRVPLSAVVLLAIITWCMPTYGESPQVVMRVALSVTLPFEFLLEQDALVFPLLAAEPVDKAEEASNGHEVDDNEQYISLGSSRELFRIRKSSLDEPRLMYCSLSSTSCPLEASSALSTGSAAKRGKTSASCSSKNSNGRVTDNATLITT